MSLIRPDQMISTKRRAPAGVRRLLMERKLIFVIYHKDRGGLGRVGELPRKLPKLPELSSFCTFSYILSQASSAEGERNNTAAALIGYLFRRDVLPADGQKAASRH